MIQYVRLHGGKQKAGQPLCIRLQSIWSNEAMLHPDAVWHALPNVAHLFVRGQLQTVKFQWSQS